MRFFNHRFQQFLVVVALLSILLPVVKGNDTDPVPPKLQNSPYQLTEIEPDLLEIKLIHTGDITYKNISDSMENTSLREVPEMVIDVEAFDYAQYADHYVHWQDVHIWDPWEMLVSDTDNDSNKEIIGVRMYPPNSVPPGEVSFYDKMYEYSDDNFIPVFDYPDSTSIVHWSGDLDDNGNQEVLLLYIYINWDSLAQGHAIQSYESQASDQLATQFNFQYNIPLVSQANHPTISDLDQDGELDMLYYMEGGELNGALCPSSSIVAEYDPSVNNFVNKYCFNQPAWYTSNYAVSDWDMDGYMEFATGGIDGEMYIVENTGQDSYQRVFEDTLDTYNAYMITSTNDMNGNGKPELWIGGDRSGSGTTIFCYESTGDNEYENVYKVRLPGAFSFYDYGVVDTDIDLDGIDELMIWTGGKIFILKNVGPESYEIIYAHKNNGGGEPVYQLHFSATSKDVSGDGYPELLISMKNGLGDDAYFFTKIYQPSGILTGVTPPQYPNSKKLLKVYPNPFNRSVVIQWPYLGLNDISIHIYDIKGRLIRSIPRSYNTIYQEDEIRWDATDNLGKEIVSGIYLIKVSNVDSQLFTKVVLLE